MRGPIPLDHLQDICLAKLNAGGFLSAFLLWLSATEASVLEVHSSVDDSVVERSSVFCPFDPSSAFVNEYESSSTAHL